MNGKKSEKSVDKRRKRWYDNKAVARESRKKVENLLAEKKFTDGLKAKKSVSGSSAKTSEKTLKKV